MSTNLPAQSLLALAENDMTLLRNALMTAAARLPVLQDREEAYAALKQINAYSATRAASPRTQSATLDDIANAVCGSIPDGYEVQLCMENGAGYVTLTTKDGQYASLPDSADKSLEEQINDALEVAKEHARRLAGEGGV